MDTQIEKLVREPTSLSGFASEGLLHESLHLSGSTCRSNFRIDVDLGNGSFVSVINHITAIQKKILPY